MSHVVVIDDERVFDADVGVYIKTVDEALAYLARMVVSQTIYYNDPIDELWLDHDLGDGGDIMIVANFMQLMAEKNMLNINQIYVHSQNPVGADNVVALLKPYFPIKRMPLPNLRSN